MQDNLSDFNGVDDLVATNTSFDLEDSCVVLLTTWSGVNGRLVQDDNIGFSVVLNILEDINNSRFEIHNVVVIIEDHLSLR